MTSRTPTIKPHRNYSTYAFLGKRKMSDAMLRNELEFDLDDCDEYMPRHSLTFALKRPRLNTYVYGASAHALNDRPCDVLCSNENSPLQRTRQSDIHAFDEFRKSLRPPEPQHQNLFEDDFKVPQLDPFLHDSKFSFLDKHTKFMSMTPRLKTSGLGQDDLLRAPIVKRSSNSCYQEEAPEF